MSMSWTYIITDWRRCKKINDKFVKKAINVYLRENGFINFSQDVFNECIRWTQKRNSMEIMCPKKLFHTRLSADLGQKGGIEMFWDVVSAKGNEKKYNFCIDARISLMNLNWTIKEMELSVTFTYGKYESHHDWTWDMEVERPGFCDWKKMAEFKDDDDDKDMYFHLLFNNYVLLTLEENKVEKVKKRKKVKKVTIKQIDW